MLNTMSKLKVACVAIVACCVISVPAAADYTNPPGWQSNPYFTHQVWQFNETGWEEDPDNPGEYLPVPPAQPLAPDGGCNNSYGTPEATWYEHAGGMFGWSYVIMGQPDISGRTGFIGGMSGGDITFDVPNQHDDQLVKELWLQYVYLGDGTNASADITAGGSTANLVQIIENEDLGEGGTSGAYHWYRRTELWEIVPQPDSETVTITLASGVSMVDQVAIDTRCIPEPATMSLLVLGGLGVLVRRKRR